MGEEVVDGFEQVVPGAAAYSDMFLKALQNQCQSQGLALSLAPVQPKRGQTRTILVADLSSGAKMLKGSPMKLRAYADPAGASLNVGWQAIKKEMTGIMARPGSMGAGIQALRRLGDSRGDGSQRNAVVSAFHTSVFQPVLSQLAAKIESQKPVTPDIDHFG